MSPLPPLKYYQRHLTLKRNHCHHHLHRQNHYRHNDWFNDFIINIIIITIIILINQHQHHHHRHYHGSRAIGCMTSRATRRFHSALKLSRMVFGSLVVQSRYDSHSFRYWNRGKIYLMHFRIEDLSNYKAAVGLKPLFLSFGLFFRQVLISPLFYPRAYQILLLV